MATKKVKIQTTTKKQGRQRIKPSKPNNYIADVSLEGSSGYSTPLDVLQPQPATVGGYTYNNPVPVLNQPAAIAPVTLSNPGADLPPDHPIYQTLTPVQDPGIIAPQGDPAFVPPITESVVTTDGVKSTKNYTMLWILLAVIVAGGMYYYYSKKK